MVFNLTDIGLALGGLSLKHLKRLYGVEHYYAEYLRGIAHEQYTNNKHLAINTKNKHIYNLVKKII